MAAPETTPEELLSRLRLATEDAHKWLSGRISELELHLAEITAAHVEIKKQLDQKDALLRGVVAAAEKWGGDLMTFLTSGSSEFNSAISNIHAAVREASPGAAVTPAPTVAVPAPATPPAP